MGSGRTKAVDEVASVLEERDRAMLLGAPGIEIADRLEDAAADIGASVVRSLHELEATDEETPVVLDDFYVNFWPDVHPEDDRSRLEDALDERLDRDAGLFLRTTPYRLKWLLERERPLFDQLFDDLNDWRVYAIRVDEATARSIVDGRLAGAVEIPDEYFERSEWSYDFGTFEDSLRDDEPFGDVFGDLGEYSSLVPATVISAYRWGEGGELFDERDSLLSTLREMLGDASASKAVEGGPKVLEGAGDFASKLREQEVWSEVVKQVGKVASDAPEQLSDVPAGAGAAALGGLTSPPVAAAGFLGYWAYATRKEHRETRETYREEFGSVFGAEALESSPAELETVEEEYGMAPRTLARLNRTARGVNWRRIDEAYERMEATSEQLDELEAVVDSNEDELNRLKNALLEHEWQRRPKVYQTLEEFEGELYETPEYVPPDYEFETEGRGVFEQEERSPAENAREKVLQILDRDRPSVVFVYGESGIGKSRLLAEVGREIRERGEKDVKFVYDPDTVDEQPPALARDTVLFVDEAGYVESAKYFLSLTAESHRREPNKDVTVQVVAAARPVYRDRVESQTVDAIAEGVDERRISVQPLDESGGRELLADLPLSDDEEKRIHEVAAGNPFLMRLLALAEVEHEETSKPPEEALQDVIENRFLGETDVLEEVLTDEQDLQTLLEVIAVLKEFVPDEDWDRVGELGSYDDISVSPLSRLMRELSNTGYLDRRGPENRALSVTYTHSYDPLAHYLRYRMLHRRVDIFKQMVESGLEIRPVEVTAGLVEFLGSPLSTFDFFDVESVTKETGRLLAEVAQTVLELDVSLEEVFEVEALIGLARPDVIPHDDLESAYKNATGKATFADAMFALLTVFYRQGTEIASHPSILRDDSDLNANQLYRKARFWVNRLEELYGDHSTDSEVSDALAKGLFNAVHAEGEAGQFEAMHQRLIRLRELADANSDDNAARERLAMGLVNAAKAEGEAGKFNSMCQRLASLKELADVHPDDETVCEQLAMGLVNVAKVEGEAGQFDAMRQRLASLKKLTDAHPDDETVREQLAMGLVNATNHEGKDGQFDAMRQRLASLEELEDRYPEDTAVREQLAKGLFNTTNFEGETNQFDVMRKRLTRLEELMHTHPEDITVREQLARGLVNAVHALGEAGQYDAIRNRLARLEELTDAHPKDAAVREALARGLVNAAHIEGEAGKFDVMRQRLVRLEELADAHPDDDTVLERLAKGLVNAMGHEGDQIDAIRQRLAQLEELTNDHLDDDAIREQLAKGLVNATGHEGESGRFDSMRKRLTRLEELAETHPHDEVVRKQLAVALFNATVLEGRTGQFERMFQRLDYLKELADEHPDDATVRKHLAKGLVNAANFEGEVGHLDWMHHRIGHLQRMADAHPDDPAVREELANGLFNAVNYEGEAGEFDRMQSRLDRLEALVEAHPDDEAVREELAKGLFNAVAHEGEAGELDRMLTRLDRLEELVEAHPDDEAVREGLMSGFNNARLAATVSGAYEELEEVFEVIERAEANYNDLGDTTQADKFRQTSKSVTIKLVVDEKPELWRRHIEILGEVYSETRMTKFSTDIVLAINDAFADGEIPADTYQDVVKFFDDY